MQPLKLSPLPCALPAEDNPAVMRGECGFVDEAVVRALMAGPVFSPRVENERLGVVAKANALDFAGWCLTTPAVVEVIPASPRRPSPPVLSDRAPGEPYRGPHPGWLAGMAGATCSLLVAGLWLQLTPQASRQSEPITRIRPTTVTSAATANDGTARAAAPQLTGCLKNRDRQGPTSGRSARMEWE
jgi:hypothetical protein